MQHSKALRRAQAWRTASACGGPPEALLRPLQVFFGPDVVARGVARGRGDAFLADEIGQAGCQDAQAFGCESGFDSQGYYPPSRLLENYRPWGEARQP